MYNSKRTLNLKIEAILVGMILCALISMFFKPVMNILVSNALNETNSLVSEILSENHE